MSSPSSPPDSPASSLYLVTFLATLFLLLLVSCAIILRSFVLRRRFQRRLDEAYAAGVILAPQAPGSHRRRYRHKPKLYTTWATVGPGGCDKWGDMMPVSALPVRVKSKHAQQQQQPWRLLPTDAEKPTRLQVAVLIAMPSPTARRSSIDKHSDDDLVPHVVFGITRIPYKH